MKAPDFKVKTAEGDKTLADYAGRDLVLYFYPKDMTSGRTTQAQNFRNLKEALTAIGTAVLGVSKDSLERHETSTEKEGLNFLLGSYEEGHMCEDYGVWKEKSMSCAVKHTWA